MNEQATFSYPVSVQAPGLLEVSDLPVIVPCIDVRRARAREINGASVTDGSGFDAGQRPLNWIVASADSDQHLLQPSFDRLQFFETDAVLGVVAVPRQLITLIFQ